MTYDITLTDISTGEICAKKSCNSLQFAIDQLNKSIGGQLAYNTTYELSVVFTTSRQFVELGIF